MGKTTEEAIMYELRGIKDRTTRLYSLCRNVSILEEKEKELQAAREKHITFKCEACTRTEFCTTFRIITKECGYFKESGQG